MTEEELENRIESELKASPGQTARQLGKTIGVHKSVLNPLLYRSNRFIQDGSNRPVWNLKEQSEQP
jgi:hypothetical protein